MRFVVLVVVGTFCFGNLLQAADQTVPESIEFNRDVRPILSENCFFCHGPDKNKREADLRLDTQTGLLGSDGHPGVVVPKEPDQSEFFARIISTDPDLQMPPADSGKQLSPQEIAILKRWIEQGASYEGHWSFQPIKNPTPPDDQGSSPPGQQPPNFIRNEIDRFILRRLHENGLQPSPEADRITLVRRLYFDLLGLPPTPDAVEQFVQDTRPEAYEELVDELLESPHFGERMAVWWLDLVRYADTVGYHGDQNMSVSPFRDYVIRSFHENKPFDVFTREQLAGDLLPNATLEQQVASGYNRLGMMSAEGGVQDKEYLAKYIAERVRNLGGTWLGMTTGCGECHDHKYDPFTMQDFYSLEAFFSDIEERGLYSGSNENGVWGSSTLVPNAEQSQKLANLDSEIAAVQKVLNSATPELQAAQSAWEKSLPQWTVLKSDSITSPHGTQFKLLEDGSILADSPTIPASDVYEWKRENPPTGITAVRLEVLPDDSLPKKGPGRANNGNFVLTEFQVLTQSTEQTEPQTVLLQNATADFEQTKGVDKSPYQKFAIAAAIDKDEQGPSWGWAVLEQVGKPHWAMFECAQPVAGGSGTTLTIRLLQNHESPQYMLGRFRIAVTSHPLPIRVEQQPPPHIAALVAQENRTEAQQTEITAYYRSISPLLEPQRIRLRELEQAKAALAKGIPTTLVTKAVMPRTVRFLKRGNWMDESGDVMQPAFPAFLPHPELPAEHRLTRLDLANWVMSPENPLPARVFTNRQWKLFFGAGLSRKLEDLGGQGEWPTHPLLLDWLATQFRESGWNVKQFVKLLVMSGSYRQSSLDTPRLREVDPSNRLLARQSRFRLDAEFVRDNALAVSGLLASEIGGKSVKPYQPPGYWAYLNFPMREWQNGTGDELYRRGVYTHWQRQYLHPSLLAFDAPNREECTADRPRSNTPLQSLALLNDPTYVEAARFLAERTLNGNFPADVDRVNWLFHQVLSRSPRPAEIEVLMALLKKHRADYQSDETAAKAVLNIGARPVAADLPAGELAAWTSVTRTLLNLHETMTRN